MTYDDILAGGESAIKGMIGKQETLQVEFKANDHREPIFQDGALTKAGRKLLAKEASAFANSAGGVIVFGVDCRAVDGIDQAERLTPIANVDRAETTVRDAAAELLQPRHDAIRVASIRSATDENAGYVVVDVPRSERRPHRSEATDQKQYFKRAGSRSYPMEHYDIEDAFRRSSSPLVILKVQLQRSTSMYEEADYYLQLALKNIGEISAKSLTLQMWDMVGPAYGIDHYHPDKNHVSSFEGRTHIGAPSDFVLHPGETRKFHQFSFKLIKQGGVVRIGNTPLTDTFVRFKFSIGAENMRREDREIDVTDMILDEAEEFFRHK